MLWLKMLADNFLGQKQILKKLYFWRNVFCTNENFD
jgi:hypothetical protein